MFAKPWTRILVNFIVFTIKIGQTCAFLQTMPILFNRCKRKKSRWDLIIWYGFNPSVVALNKVNSYDFFGFKIV